MKMQFPELPEWEFDLDEVSANVYVMSGRDKAGRSVSAQGIDPDALKERCRNDAIDISQRNPSRKKPHSVEMKFEQPEPLSRDSLSREIDSNDPTRVATAIIAAALYEGDRSYVETLIVRFLQHNDPDVRAAAALAAGHVARIHRSLSVDRIVPLIERLLTDSQMGGMAQDALDDIHMFLGKT